VPSNHGLPPLRTLSVFVLIATLAVIVHAEAIVFGDEGAADSRSMTPSVLFIMSDDLRPELGCSGSVAVTPHLDRLASTSLGGVRFTRAYCQQAVCNPSRSSMLTGRRPDTLCVWSNSVHFREVNPDVETIPSWFKRHGYETRCVGKIFHNWHTAVHGDPGSWSAPEYLHYANHGHDAPFANLGLGERPPAELPPNLAIHSHRNYGLVPLDECRDLPDEAYFDGRVAAEAVRLIEEGLPDRPFFLAVGFWKPHAPFTAPKRYWDLYDRASLPALDSARPSGAPAIAFHESTEVLGSPANRRPLTADQIAEMRHGYFAGVSFLDAQVGRLLDALDRTGRLDETIVVFSSDHGYHLGEHDLWAKTSVFELDTRVPLIVRLPPRAAAEGGFAPDALVELIDIFPTLVEAAGLPAPAGLDGQSLLPLVRGERATGKPAAFSQHPRPAYFDRGPSSRPDAMGVSVRTHRARYTEWRDWTTGRPIACELYDHDRDPLETINVVDAADLATVQQEATELLRARFPEQPHPKGQVDRP
ncbi:MAG: sulfatase, partial [Planctomycetaceae bacterium]